MTLQDFNIAVSAILLALSGVVLVLMYHRPVPVTRRVSLMCRVVLVSFATAGLMSAVAAHRPGDDEALRFAIFAIRTVIFILLVTIIWHETAERRRA